MRSPFNLLLSKLNKLSSSLILSSQEKCSGLWVIILALLWTFSESSLSFLCCVHTA